MRILSASANSAPATALTKLSFLAQRRPKNEHLLDEVLSGRLDKLGEVALDVAVETGDPLGKVLARRLETEGTIELMHRLVERLSRDPYASVLTLRDVSVVALARCLDHYRDSWSELDDAGRGYLAGIALNLAQDLSYLGRWDEALTAQEEALAMLRATVDPDPSTLATYLLEYSTILNKLGRTYEALKISREAVALRRLRAGADSNLPLAGDLTNLAADLSDLGHVPESLRAATEAVDIYELHQEELDDFGLHRFSNALVCQGNQLNYLGRHAEARQALERAVALRRQLAADLPSAFQPELALALADFALLLYNLDREQEADKLMNEATEIYERLAEDRPTAFDPALAWSLSRGLRGTRLSTAGQMKRAGEMLEQAVRLFRRLAGNYPRAFDGQLAEALDAQSDQHLQAGRPEAALEAVEEAIDTLQRLMEDRNSNRVGVLYSLLGWCLIHRAKARGALGRWNAALDDARRSVKIFDQQEADGRLSSRRARAAAYHELGIRLLAAGQPEDGLDATTRSVELYRSLAAEQPGVYLSELASALLTLGGQFHALGDLEVSVETSREALKICRQVVAQSGDEFRDMIAIALNNIGLVLFYLDRLEEALPPAQEALGIFHALGDRYLCNEEHLADCELTVGIILDDLEQSEEASQLLDQAVTRRRRLAEALPQSLPTDLAYCLNNLAAAQHKLGRHEEAVRACREATDILRRGVAERRPNLESRLGAALSNLAAFLRRLGRPDEAIDAAREALKYLVPRYGELSPKIQRATLSAMGHYFEASKEGGAEPDYELLEPLLIAYAQNKLLDPVE